MTDRKHLTVYPEIFKIIENEVERRNKKRDRGRKHTNTSVTEEAILYWEKVRKEQSK